MPLLALWALALSIVPPPAVAQQADSTASQAESGTINTGTVDKPPAEALPVPPPAVLEKRYLVEVIVFNYHGPISARGEIWHRMPPIQFTPPPAAVEPELQVENPADPIDPVEPTELDDPVEFTVLKALAPYLAKLHANPQYEVVTYTAWTQPLFEKNESIRVELVPQPESASVENFRPLMRPPLQGGLQMFENRLLFVELDIKNEFEAQPIDPYGPITPETDSPAGTFRLHEKRRVKLNEIHYFDHPYFGALVRVSRWEPRTG